jgi:hypothetical protein
MTGASASGGDGGTTGTLGVAEGEGAGVGAVVWAEANDSIAPNAAAAATARARPNNGIRQAKSGILIRSLIRIRENNVSASPRN